MNFILFHFLPCRGSFDSYQLFWPNGIIFTVTKLDLPEMGVSKNNGTPKWMVKIMENPIKNG